MKVTPARLRIKPNLVPTLRVGTHDWDALRPVSRWAATQSVAYWRSHAERGNEKG